MYTIDVVSKVSRVFALKSKGVEVAETGNTTVEVPKNCA